MTILTHLLEGNPLRSFDLHDEWSSGRGSARIFTSMQDHMAGAGRCAVIRISISLSWRDISACPPPSWTTRPRRTVRLVEGFKIPGSGIEMWHLMVFEDEARTAPVKVMSFETVNEVSYVVGLPSKTVYNYSHRLERGPARNPKVCFFPQYTAE